MAKPKTIMDMTPQELLKMFVASVGELIKAENRTQETILRAELASKQDIAGLETDIQRVEQDIKRVEQKLDTKLADHETRVTQLEEDSKFLPHSH